MYDYVFYIHIEIYIYIYICKIINDKNVYVKI